VNTTTINNVAPPVLPAVLPSVLPAVVPAAAAAVLDVCQNLPGVQPGVPAGFVLTFARNGGLVCVTPQVARILHPTAVKYQVPAGRPLIYQKRGRMVCIGLGKASAKPKIVAATTRAGKVLRLAGKGKLVCLRP
jgi:hypothetical protein